MVVTLVIFELKVIYTATRIDIERAKKLLKRLRVFFFQVTGLMHDSFERFFLQFSTIL